MASVERALTELRLAATAPDPGARILAYRHVLEPLTRGQLEHLLAVYTEGTVHGSAAARTMAQA